MQDGHVACWTAWRRPIARNWRFIKRRLFGLKRPESPYREGSEPPQAVPTSTRHPFGGHASRDPAMTSGPRLGMTFLVLAARRLVLASAGNTAAHRSHGKHRRACRCPA
jgi:hypothetical protein